MIGLAALRGLGCCLLRAGTQSAVVATMGDGRAARAGHRCRRSVGASPDTRAQKPKRRGIEKGYQFAKAERKIRE